MRQVTATIDGKCSKCGRDIKKGFTVFYDDEKKLIFCKYCETSASTPVPAQVSEPSPEIKVELGLLMDMTSVILDEIRGIKFDIEKLYGLCSKLTAKPDKKK